MDINTDKAPLILSTDALGGYGLDVVFDLAKSAGFSGLDLCVWKNFDARNPKYVKKLIGKYDLPVRVIQVSDQVNQTELNQALDLCEAVGAKIITINAPPYLGFSSYNFIKNNLANYQTHNGDIRFAIINPDDGSYFGLPVPQYRFRNIVEIIKKYNTNLGCNISQMNQDYFEGEFFKKLDKFIGHIPVIYLSDKAKIGTPYLIPGEGILKLSKFLKKTKDLLFTGFFSIKVQLNKQTLTDVDKVLLILKRCVAYYEEYYQSIEISPLTKS